MKTVSPRKKLGAVAGVILPISSGSLRVISPMMMASSSMSAWFSLSYSRSPRIWASAVILRSSMAPLRSPPMGLAMMALPT